jgi:hypothetical protein
MELSQGAKNRSELLGIVLFIVVLTLAACEQPSSSVTYIFVENANTPVPIIPSETPSVDPPTVEALALPTTKPTEIPPPTPTPMPTPTSLEVVANVDPVCNTNGKFIEVIVRLRVSGGIPPYFVNDKEIDPSTPVLRLKAGSYNEFDIKSSDGQVEHMRVWAPATCEDATSENIFNPPSPVSGCTDSNASNYNPLATVDDGSCKYPVPGCTDSTAINYNPLATVDDGSCRYHVYGCMDPAATNYDPSATVDDGSCVYPPPQCNDGVDNDGDGEADWNIKKNKGDRQCQSVDDDDESN